MAGTTPKLDLYLPGGGLSGAYGSDEPADIDKLNENFVKIDTFAQGLEGMVVSDTEPPYVENRIWFRTD